MDGRVGIAKRGPLTIKRKDIEEVTPRLADNHIPEPATRYHDWRDYNLYQFGGIDPNALCVYPADTEDLDSPEYQALSASCKLVLMWQKVLADTYREDFFVGPEFTSLFN